MRRTQAVSLTATFAALHAVLGFLTLQVGPWRNWAIYLEPFEGIILGPKIGFFAVLLGSSIARMAGQSGDWMFGVIAEPIGVMMAGLLSRARWRPCLAIYAVMLSAYLIHPFGTALPLWTILDVLVALLLIYPTAKLSSRLRENDVRRLAMALAFLAFTVIATDSLVRVFLLVPGGLHRLFYPDFTTLYSIFVGYAAFSYVEDCVAVAVSILVGVPLVLAVFKLVHNEKQPQTSSPHSRC